MITPHRVSIDTAFSTAMELEDAAAGLYRRFARLFADQPEVTAFWQHISDDEDRHYLALHYSQRLLKDSPVLDLELDVDLGRLQEIVKVVQRAATRAVDRDYSLREAIGVAWMVEMSEADRLLDLLTRLPDECLNLQSQGFRKMLVNGTDDHRARLRDFAAAHGVALP